jgi:hypothetical protein
MPYQGTRIVLFYDRLLLSVTRSQMPSLWTRLAHEIAHVLQGISRHSASGMMKAKWDGRGLRGDAGSTLGFTDEDVALIHSRMDEKELQASRRDSTGAISVQ